MDEETAKSKWCPMVRFCAGVDDDNAANRWPNSEKADVCNCVASACMMWRWAEYGIEELGSVRPEGANDSVYFNPQTKQWWKQTSTPISGHCGLAKARVA